MSKNVIISVRLDDELLKKVDEFKRKASYLNRTKVITNCISAVLQCCSEDDTAKVVHTWDPYADGLQLVIKPREAIKSPTKM